jgi:NAD(P)-dependent dehydrogenase (short-subunit alcohol dehydrogenase family)
MGKNLATVLAGEGVTVNAVSHMEKLFASTNFLSRSFQQWLDLPTWFLLQNQREFLDEPYLLSRHTNKIFRRTWTNKTDLAELKDTDPGLAIAASVPVRRLGHPQEVANVAVMWVYLYTKSTAES